MKLRTKVSVVLAIVVVLSVVLNAAVLHNLVLPSFVELEQAQARQDLERIRQAIGSDLTQIAATTIDWARWDDTYQYAIDGNEAYAEENMYYSAFEGLDLDVIYVFNVDGQVVSGHVFDFENEDELPIADFELSHLSPSNSLLQHPEERLMEITTGVVQTARGPLLVGSGAILNNDGQGPSHGTLIMGRFFSPTLMQKLKDQTRVDFQTWLIGQGDLEPAEREALEQITADGRDVVLRDDGEALGTYAVLSDLTGKPTLLLRADTPKAITATGMHTVNVALLGLAAAGLIAMAVIAILLRRLMLAPLSELTEHILAVGTSGDLSKRVGLDRADEIGVLAAQFDRMIASLAEARDRLQQQSFQAGVAEMAAGVLHNLRNQLNPLVLRLGRLQQFQIAPPSDRFTQVLAELGNGEVEPGRRAKLVEYLRLSKEQSQANQGKLRDEIDHMMRQIGLVEEVLAEQDRFSGTKRAVEPTSLLEVVTRAHRMMPDGIGKGYQLRIDPSIEHAPAVLAEPFVLTHVLHNLLANAAEAIDASTSEQGEIEVAASIEAAADDGPVMHVAVRDNGRGIDAAHWAAIFERGFTTKKGGKGGSGLHWCANSVANLNGRIYATSDGPGRGATLHLILPMPGQAGQAAA